MLLDTVADHLRSDVPYGLFLSGGIDSSVLVAPMARLTDHPVYALRAGSRQRRWTRAVMPSASPARSAPTTT